MKPIALIALLGVCIAVGAMQGCCAPAEQDTHTRADENRSAPEVRIEYPTYDQYRYRRGRGD